MRCFAFSRLASFSRSMLIVALRDRMMSPISSPGMSSSGISSCSRMPSWTDRSALRCAVIGSYTYRGIMTNSNIATVSR